MGIPAIIGVGDALQTAYAGHKVLMDGQTGETFLAADPAIREQFLKKRNKEPPKKLMFEQWLTPDESA